MPNSTSNSISNSSRLHNIDALRGLVVLFMLFGHVYETFFLHRQVGDSVDVANTEPALFLSRILMHLRAPVFVFLTGLSAFFYDEKYQRHRAISVSLFRRGLFLMVLELTLMSLVWTFQLSPTVVYLQVIWATGLSMLVLAALLWLPRPLLAVFGVLLAADHNLPDPLHFAPGSAWHLLWAVLHDRDWIEAGDVLRSRISYPLLPWIGVVALSYAVGNWFSGATPATTHRRYLLVGGGELLLGFILLRLLNGCGEKPWVFGEMSTITLMGFFNVTGYPPSLLFLAPTLGIDLPPLAWFERLDQNGHGKTLMTFDEAPMLFYLLYLHLLKLLYLLVLAVWGANRGDYFGFPLIPALRLCSILLVVTLYPAVHWFVGFRAQRWDVAWLEYF